MTAVAIEEANQTHTECKVMITRLAVQFIDKENVLCPLSSFL